MSVPPERAIPACFHCGLPVSVPGAHQVAILGAQREMCCPGCATVASTIVAAGFERYYETREIPAAQPPVFPAMQDLPATDIYDDPLAQHEFVVAGGEHEREASLILDHIRCAACLWLNEQYLRRLSGVTRITINYATRRAQVCWDTRRVRLSQIIAAVRAIGYDAYPYDPDRQKTMQRGEARSALWRLFVAGFGAMQVMMYAIPRYLDDGATMAADSEQLMRWASLALTLPVLVFSCGPFFSGALADLRAGRAGIDVPLALGIAAGFGASAWATLTGGGDVYFDSITMLVFLLLGARYVELGARQKAAGRLDRLARWMPMFAERLNDSADLASAVRVPAHALKTGDRVLIAAGETVPADGIIEQGESSTDESLLTGESLPVGRRPGSPLIAGSINIEQPLVIRVTHAGTATQAAAIGRLIERAAAGRPRLVESADRLAHALTWIVLASAAGAFAIWGPSDPVRAFWIAVALLVVTCPCALALAAPIALTALTGQLARRGVVLTRAHAIESATRISDVVLDKTGTLTEGRLRLVRIEPCGPASADACLGLARSLEAGSRHPIARALREDSGPGTAAGEICALRQFPGNGVQAQFGERRVRLGSLAFVAELAGPPAGEAAVAGHLTPVYLGDQGGWIARFLLEDRLRADARSMVAALQAQGLALHLVSGDAPAVVAHYAAELGIQSLRAAASPQAKYAYVEELQRGGRIVAAIGDGLNDAPVLARADLSIAMGEGAALAQSQADLVLLTSRLSAVTEALAEARRAMRIVRQNFGWASAYNLLALPLTLAGFVGPWEAAVGMAASSFLVVLNALRLVGEPRGVPGVGDASPALARG